MLFGLHLQYTLQFDVEEDRVKQKKTYNFWSSGRPEKLVGIAPVSLLFDKSLHGDFL